MTSFRGAITTILFSMIAALAFSSPARPAPKWRPEAKPAHSVPNLPQVSRASVHKASSKLSPRLRQFIARKSAEHERPRRMPAGEIPPAPESERIRVFFEMAEITDADLQTAASMGGRILRQFSDRLAVSLPFDRVELAAGSLSNVASARLPLRFFPSAVPGEGVGLSGAADFHLRGMTGQGVRVAVIDAGFKGLSAAQAAGDLPVDVVTRDFTGNGLETQYLHGTACAEIVHEMAPGAALHLLKISDEIDIYDAFDHCVENDVRIVSLSMGTAGTGPGDGTKADGASRQCFEGRSRALGAVLQHLD